MSNPTTHVSDSMRLSYALWFTLLFLVTIWAVFILNETLELGWRKHGLHPRTFQGWQGVFLYPFLHGDWGHLWNNTMSFFTLNGFLFYFYRSIAIKVWVWLYALSGLLLWGLAVDGNHIGASGIIYGLAAFLFLSGVIRENRLLLRVSLAVAFLYGGIVWWMLPIDDHVSWEGHLSGAIVGSILALVFRRQGPQDPVYRYEQEEANQVPLPEWWMAAHPNHPDTIAQRQAEAKENDSSGASHGTEPLPFSRPTQS